MRLILVRHAKAKPADPKKFKDDSQRPVSKSGERKFKSAAKGLGNIVKPDAVLTSPFARTLQTAAMLQWDAGWPAAVADESLDVKHAPEDVISRIRELPDSPATVALVGHGDELKQLADHLLGNDAETPGISFDKGGAASIKTKRSMKPGAGTLEWAMRQKELKKHQ